MSFARNRYLAQGLRELKGTVIGFFARRNRTHNLDQLHDRDGIEEVKPDEAIGPGMRRHVRDGQRTRIRREDRALSTEPVELSEECVLHFEILDDRFDDDVAVTEIGHGGGER